MAIVSPDKIPGAIFSGEEEDGGCVKIVAVASVQFVSKTLSGISAQIFGVPSKLRSFSIEK